MSFTILIPARLASTRLPNKPLADIGGAPMVVRVAQRAALSQATRVVVACDSDQIAAACAAHGVQAVLTKVDHPSGSDRLAEACDKLGLGDDALVVNVQGDEPLIDPGLINAVASLLQKNQENKPLVGMGTAAHAIEDIAEQTNPNIVKVVLDANNHALYFSRSLIPFNRDGHALAPQPLRHIGIYSYRAGFLRSFPKLPQAPIEVSESLEQLRALWHGHRIAVHVSAQTPGPGVDTPQDLERVRKLWALSVSA
jgi:3-deoxy-manno-octulosonate cytidylyltransferase (CMP-KDO synthetase)